MFQANGRLLLKRHFLIWRARFSMPALLMRFDEKKVVSAVTAVNGGLAILTISLFAWLTDLPLIFPALGPTAFILFSSPLSPAAAPRSVVVGHLSCLTCGWAVWHLMSHLAGGPVSAATGGWPLFCGASLGLAVSCLLLVRLSCPHPPACASALVAALGGVMHWDGLFFMSLAVIWLTVQAVTMNRLAGLPVPVWHPRDYAP